MTTRTKRNWWRAAVAIVVGGTAVGGGWLGLNRFAEAQPIRHHMAGPTPREQAEAVAWTRSQMPQPAAVATPTTGTVTTASAVLPPVPVSAVVKPVIAAPLPVLPVIPAATPMLPVPTSPPPIAAPTVEPKTAAPVPAVPEFRPVVTPILPPDPVVLPAPKPVEVAKPALPALPADPVMPPPIAAVPMLPALPSPKVPPPAELTAPAPPAKSAEPVRPVPPMVPDFNLRPEDTGNSVKSGPPVVPPAPVAKVKDRPKPADEPFATTEKFVFPLPEAAPIAAIPVSRTTFPDPILPTLPTTIATAPGESTMTLKQTAIAAALGGALALAPTQPVAALPLPTFPVKADPAPKSVEERLKDIERNIAEMTEALKGKKDSLGITLPSDPGLLEEVKRLRNEVAALKSRIDAMEKSTSLRPSPGPAAVAGKGTIRVVNDYPIEITIVVNESSHRIAAGKTKEIEVAAGEFTYLLLSSGVASTPTKSTIKDKEVVTLRIK